MSFSLHYRSLFISDGTFLLPLVEEGPSNLWENRYGSTIERRVRNWYIPRLDGKYHFTPASFLFNADHVIETTDDSIEYVKIRSRYVTKHEYLRYLKRKVASAITPAQATMLGIKNVSLEVTKWEGFYDNVKRESVTVMKDEIILNPLNALLTTISGHPLGKYSVGISSYIPEQMRMRILRNKQ